MPDQDSELRVVRRSHDGRRRYDEKSKRALVEAAIRPGVSVARLAQKHEINANLLRKWITKYLMEREKGISSASQNDCAEDGYQPTSVEEIDGVPIDICGPRKGPVAADSPCAFVPVVSATKALPPAPLVPSMTFSLHVRLANGVEFDLGKPTIDELSAVVQMLGRMPCFGSTKI
ncbi:MAG: transposase [Caballeronia sp.]|jgi:transposase|nr:transposase [Caballeronia sp.]